MTIIKLDAIDSTNDFLKELLKKQEVENFTVVVANEQTNGRGQMGTSWNSEKGKSLIMSFLLKDLNLQIEDVFVLNAMISVAVVEALSLFAIPKLSVKWPNDIMSDNKKIAGILVENSLKPDNTILSVVGIGLNVNQTKFDDLPNASSLFLQQGNTFSVDEVRDEILTKIRLLSDCIIKKEYNYLWQLYHQFLFKKGTPLAFEEVNAKRFMGIIQGVSQQGLLEVELENEEVRRFSIKEIKMLY